MRATRVMFLGASLVFVACGGAKPTPEDAGVDAGEFIPTTNAEHNQMLNGLGFKTDLGARLDPAGREVPDTYHPLKTRFAVFHPRAEVYLAGITIGGKSEHLFDDSSGDYARLPLTSKEDRSWTGASLKNGVAGDLDGDGFDEVFVVYYIEASKRLRYIALDVNGAVVKEGELDSAANSATLDAELQPALATGDLDGDGRDEVVVGFGRFYLVDRLEGDPVVTIKQHPNQDQNETFVAMGNLDWDGDDELVVTYTTTSGQTVGHYAIYDGAFDTPTQTGALTFTDPNNATHTARETQVTIGDVDGDRLGEIIFGGLVEGNGWSLFILEYNRPVDVPLYAWRSFYVRVGASGRVPRPLFVLDWDGDGRKEVFFNTKAWQVTRDPTPKAVDTGFGATLHRAVPGDVDGDGRDDIIFEWGTVQARGLNSLDKPATKVLWSGSSASWQTIILASANVDADSPVVRHDGEHELLFSDPHVVAVLASPPYQAGVGQNVDATASTFGKSTGETVERETSLGITTGFSVGYEADFGIFGGAEFSMTIETSLDVVAGQSTTVEKYHSYTSGPGEDKVVFSTVPFDVYYYTIISSPDPVDVGRTVSINVPRDPQTLSTTREFYNSHNGGGLDIDKGVLPHTPGDVWSYPTLAQRDAILNAAVTREEGYKKLWNGPLVVGEGGGYDTIGISRTQGSSRGASMEFSVEFEFSATSPGGAKVGSSVGFRYGHSYTFSTEDTAFFEGTVGNIPAAAYSANRYRYGLFVYPEAVGGQKFLVMNYWTEQ